jgi:hypothetical protein
VIAIDSVLNSVLAISVHASRTEANKEMPLTRSRNCHRITHKRKEHPKSEQRGNKEIKKKKRIRKKGQK